MVESVDTRDLSSRVERRVSSNLTTLTMGALSGTASLGNSNEPQPKVLIFMNARPLMRAPVHNDVILLKLSGGQESEHIRELSRGWVS